MRNLKRAFSLVLALVMALSVVTIAPVAAADETAPATVTSNFTDAAEINYKEAVAITGGIGLFAGADGKFMPKGTVTRAQMATIIVKMLYGGDVNADSFKGSGKFIDTAYFEGGWAEGYINWCSTLGIVAGYGDGTFKPGNQVTTAEAATMILNALKIDAGAGTWPNTVMAKAEEEDFFEDLKPMPGTNTALTREELAVIALNGLNWTSSDEIGWYVTGGTADEKMTFPSYKDAQTYANKTGGQVQPLEGRDSLANKVYDLKKATGFITANQATGAKYTEVTVNWSPAATAKFNVETGANMIGHKVEVWYEEQYVSEREPGKTYAVSEAAEYITLTEDAETAKEYKAAFGTKYDLPGDLIVTNGRAYVSNGGSIDGYVANSYAPAGTYAIDIETGALCGYIAPAAYTIAKVGYVNTTEGQETITVGSNTWSNTAEDDEVVEYEGIAKDDYVAYTQLQDMYVLVQLGAVTGNVNKVREEDGLKVVTIDGKEYTQSSAAGSIPNTFTAANLGSVDHQQTYTFFLDPYGKFVCYEVAQGSGFDMSNTFFVLGVIGKEDADSYGKKATTFLARGVDMTGNEALVPIGYQEAGSDVVIGTNAVGAQGFYSVEENRDSKETRELGLKKIVAINPNWSNEEPVAVVFQRGVAGANWQPGGQFEYGVGDVYTGNQSFSYKDPTGKTLSTVSALTKTSKFVLVEGSAEQDYPLETSVSTGSFSLNIGATTDIYAILTRTNGGLWNVEAMVIPLNNLDQGKNATMIYVPRVAEVNGNNIEWVNMTPSGTDAIGNVYSVYDALTGSAMEITLSSEITEIPSGFYSIAYDSEEELYKIAISEDTNLPYQVPQGNITQLRSASDPSDGRYQEGVAYDQILTAMSGSSIYTETFGASSISTSGVKVIDVRSDEAIAASGLAKITSLDQLWSLQESCGEFMDFELDITWKRGSASTFFVEAYNNAAYGVDTLVYGFDYDDTQVTVVTGKMHATNAVIDLPTGLTVARPGFYWLAAGTNGVVGLMPATLDGVAGVAFDADELPAYDTLFNAAAIDNFDAYDVIEYQLLTVDGADILVIVGVGDEAESGVTAEALIDAADYNSVVDTTDSDITLANLNAKQNAMCMVYTAYDMVNGNKLLVINEVDEGILIDTEDALADVDDATVINNTEADFDDLAELKALSEAGYIVSAKLYEVEGETLLVVSQCMNGNTVAGALSASSFAKDNVKLTGDATLAGTITVPAGETWLIDLAGNTLSGSVAPYFEINGNLIVTDTVGGGVVEGFSGATKAMFVVKGEMTLEGGLLTGHDTSAATGGTVGGAVYVDKNCTFNMTGGEISGNSAKRGAAVTSGDVPASGAIFNMTGGLIENNNCTERGGNVYMFAGVTTLGGTAVIGDAMRDGSVNNGVAQNSDFRDGTVTVTGGTYTSLTEGRSGGNGVGLAKFMISGNPVIETLYQDGTAKVSTIGSLLTGANVTVSIADGLNVNDDTVAHTAGTKAYTCASGVLNIKVQQPVGGTVEVSSTSALKDSEITVTATAAAGYELVAILVDGEAIDGDTFVVTKDHKVTAEFALIDYDVDLADGITGGMVQTMVNTAKMGETVTVGVLPHEGKEVHSVKFNGVNATKVDEYTYTFEMPAEDVVIEVVFGDIQYNITKTVATGGTVTVKDKAVAGETVTITATANAGYRVGTITVTGATVTDGEFTMPAGDVTVTVTFIQGVSKTYATAEDLPSDYEVEDNEFGVTTENIESKLAANDIDFTYYGKVVVIDKFSAGKSTFLTQTSGDLAAGKYRLGADMTLTGTLKVKAGSTVTIDLAGYDISGPVVPLIQVMGSNAVLNLNDSVGTGTITGGTNASLDNYGMISVTTGTFNMYGGKLTGYNYTGANNRGGAVAVLNGVTNVFNMYGGEISGNKANNGAGVYAHTATINIYGGTITGNTASNHGGGVYGDKNAIVNIKGGDITGNTGARGNEVCMGELCGGTLTIDGGTIGGGSGTYDGIYCHTGTLNINGGEIAKVYWRYGTVNVTGGEIEILRAGANATTAHYLYISGNPVIDKLQLDSGFEYEGTTISITDLEAGASIHTDGNSYANYITIDETVDHSASAPRDFKYKG